MRESIPYLVTTIGALVFFHHRLMRYLRYFQQEEYSHSRFCRWIVEKRRVDKRASFILMIAALTGLSLSVSLVVLTLFIAMTLLEEDPLKEGKIVLKMTERANRILQWAFVFQAATALLVLTFPTLKNYSVLFCVSLLFLVQSTPFWLLAANRLLMRKELKRQEEYLHEAKTIIRNVNPFIIGITGSYGKTSTKDALGSILQTTLGPTFYPPKSVNTLMGITREVRSHLCKGHQYAIFEMAAYKIGSIEKLCALAPPKAAIITSIGSAHLERFKTVETIAKAKSELAKAVPEEGILVCNGDDPRVRAIAKQYPKTRTFFYGLKETLGPVDCLIGNIETLETGTRFTIRFKGQIYDAMTPLMGNPSLSNIAACFTTAVTLGSDPEYVIAAIANLEPVDNRLQVKKVGGVTFIRDAYNSNPSGFEGALEVLNSLKGNRKILMTPGMIELGSVQEEENTRLGQKAASICDVALIVGKTNQSALMKGLEKGGMTHDKIILCSTREVALQKIDAMKTEHDLILIENDLTDLYETPFRC